MNFAEIIDQLAEAKGPATRWLEANSEVIAKWKLEDDADQDTEEKSA